MDEIPTNQAPAPAAYSADPIDGKVVGPGAPRRRSRWVLGRSVMLGLVGLAWLSAGVGCRANMDPSPELAPQPEPTQPCTEARSHLDGVWDDELRSQIKRSILATARPDAPDVSARVRQQLDAYAYAWAAKHTAVCEATSVRGEQTTEAMDLRMGCLHEHKQTLGAAVRVLAEADDAVVQNAVSLVEALPSMDRCDDLDRLRQARQRVPPPDDPEVARQVEALRKQLAGIKIEYEAGRYADVLEHIEPVMQQAQMLGYEPLRAEALLQRGRTHEKSDQLAHAELDLEQAFALATEHGQDQMAAEAVALLAWVVGVRQERGEPGLAWGKMAVALSVGPKVEAVTQAVALRSLGAVVSQRGEQGEALVHLQRALAINERVRGIEHVSTASILGSIATTLSAQGQRAEALTHWRRALAIEEKLLGGRHPQVAFTLLELGRVLHEQGNLPEARTHLERALAIFEQTLGADHLAVATTLASIGAVQADRDEPAEALTYMRRAVAIRERALGPEHPAVIESLSQIGRVLPRQGKRDEAEAFLRRALELGERVLGPEDPQLAIALIGLAELALDRRDFKFARVHAERALSICESSTTAPDRLAEARFMLARALWNDRTERARAQALAQKARDAFAERGPGREDERATVEAWLAARR
ncbi:MAG: tetratricopeptide repeat protein [Myxococcota bacterium]